MMTAKPKDDFRRVHEICSVLLRYPDSALRELLPAVDRVIETLPQSLATPLAAFTHYLHETDLFEVQQHYVETFDMRRKCSPYLTYWTHGDTRNRGMALLAFKNAYRSDGLTTDETELPDHIAVVLEFAAQTRSPLGDDLLGEHRAVLELLHEALRVGESPYHQVLSAVLATTSPLTAEGARRMEHIAAQGPPTELVGVAGPLDLTLTPYGTAGDLLGDAR
jgi:nitrate reductase delta subunit